MSIVPEVRGVCTDRTGFGVQQEDVQPLRSLPSSANILGAFFANLNSHWKRPGYFILLVGISRTESPPANTSPENSQITADISPVMLRA